MVAKIIGTILLINFVNSFICFIYLILSNVRIINQCQVSEVGDRHDVSIQRLIHDDALTGYVKCAPKRNSYSATTFNHRQSQTNRTVNHANITVFTHQPIHRPTVIFSTLFIASSSCTTSRGGKNVTCWICTLELTTARKSPDTSDMPASYFAWDRM